MMLPVRTVELRSFEMSSFLSSIDPKLGSILFLDNNCNLSRPASRSVHTSLSFLQSNLSYRNGVEGTTKRQQ
jgi:hypothetical protein